MGSSQYTTEIWVSVVFALEDSRRLLKEYADLVAHKSFNVLLPISETLQITCLPSCQVRKTRDALVLGDAGEVRLEVTYSPRLSHVVSGFSSLEEPKKILEQEGWTVVDHVRSP